VVKAAARAGVVVILVLEPAALEKRQEVGPDAVGAPLMLSEVRSQYCRRGLNAVRAVVERAGYGIGLRDERLTLTVQLLRDRVLGEGRPEEAVNRGILSGFLAVDAAPGATGTRPRSPRS